MLLYLVYDSSFLLIIDFKKSYLFSKRKFIILNRKLDLSIEILLNILIITHMLIFQSQ